MVAYHPVAAAVLAPSCVAVVAFAFEAVAEASDLVETVVVPKRNKKLQTYEHNSENVKITSLCTSNIC